MTGKEISIDTNIIIDSLEGTNTVNSIFIKIEKEEIISVVSTLVECELMSSKKIEADPKYKRDIEFFLASCEIVLVDRIIARKAAEFRRKYSIKTPDAIIAATAFFTPSKTLLTSNVSDFKKVTEIKAVSPKNLF